MNHSNSLVLNRSRVFALLAVVAAQWLGQPLASQGQANWNFESGTLAGWTKTGTAFDNQPTYGNNVAARSPGIVINEQGNYWIGTYEDHHNPGDAFGGIQGDFPIGTLISDPFAVGSGFLSFLIGGGRDMVRVRVELLIQGDPPSDLPLWARFLGIGAPVDLSDGRYFVANYASGRNREEMREQTFDYRPYAGRTGRIRILENSTTRHINCDNFQLSGVLAGDIWITGIEVTQAIQTYPDMTLPLIRGKPTLVRVYVQSLTEVSGPARNVMARLTVRTGPITRTHEPTRPTRAITVPVAGSDRRTLRDSFSFLLDYDETINPSCELDARIFPLSPQPERNLANNWLSRRVDFIPSSRLNVYRATYANRSSGVACTDSAPDGYRPPPANFEVHRLYALNAFPLMSLNFVPFFGDPTLAFDNSTCDAYNASDVWLGNMLDRTFPLGGRRGFILQPEGTCACGLWYTSGAHNHGIRSHDLRDPQGTFAQELAHSFDRPHAPCDVSPDNWLDPAFPWSDGSLGPDVGIRFSPTLSALPGRNSAGERVVADFMGYCLPDWVSAYTFCQLLSAIAGRSCGTTAAPLMAPAMELTASNSEPLPGFLSPSMGNSLRNNGAAGALGASPLTNQVFIYVTGTVTGSNAVFEPFEMISSAENIATTTQGASYQLVFEDKFQTPLQMLWLDPSETSRHDTNAPVRFGLFAPWVAGTTHIVLLDGLTAAVLARRDVSAHFPQITLLSPAGGENWLGKHTIEWQASDADNEVLTYSLYYSADGGNRWLPLQAGLTTPSWEVDFDNLPGSDQALIRVAASDGVNTTTAEPNGFLKVPRKGPRVSISGHQGASVTNPPSVLYGTAFDWESGPITDSSAFQWSSDLAGPLGSGEWINLASLSAGTHQISLSVYDSDQNSATDHVTITILSAPVEPLDTTSPALLSAGSLDGRRIDLCFSERVTPSSAENLANYSIDGGSNPVTAARLGIDRKTVMLFPMTSVSDPQGFVVTATNIEDLSGNFGGGTATGGLSQFQTANIGLPSISPETLSRASNSVLVTAAGLGVDGVADQFHFVHRSLTGDFDVRVRLQMPEDQVVLPSPAPFGGLVARESSNATSRSVAALVSLASAGSPFTALRRLTGGNTEYIPSPVDPTFDADWLRLTRQHNTFVSYASSNGLDWVLLAQTDLSSVNEGSVSPTLIVGFAAMSLDSNLTATVEFRDYQFDQPPAPCLELTCPTNFIAFVNPSADCNNNGIPDASDIADGRSFDRNLNGVPDECEQVIFYQPTAVDACCGTNFIITESRRTNGTCPQVITRIWHISDCAENFTSCTQIVTLYRSCPVLFSGLTNTPIGSALTEMQPNPQTGSPQLVVHNFSNLGIDGVGIHLGAAQFASVGFEWPDPTSLPDGANVTFRAIGAVNGSNSQAVATFQAVDAGYDTEYRGGFDALGDVPLLAVLYDGSSVVGTARIPTRPPYPPFARVTGGVGDARITPYMPADGYPAMILEWPQARPKITLTGSQPLPGTRIVVMPDVPKLSLPERTFELSNDMLNTGLNFWWRQGPGNPLYHHVFMGPVSRIDVLAEFVPQVVILSEEVGMFGLAHRALEGTQLSAQASPAELTVLPLPDAPGTGSIEIVAGAGDAWNGNRGVAPFDFNQRLLYPDWTNNAFIETGLVIPMLLTNQTIAKLTARRTGPATVNISADFSALNWPGSPIAQVLSNGLLVGSIIANNGAVANISTWPHQFTVASKPYPASPFLAYGWSSNIVFDLNDGSSAVGNELRVAAPSGYPFPQDLKGVSLRFGGLSNICLIKESVAPSGLYFQGLAHEPLGSASLTTVSNTLVVAVPGTNSGDGVSLALGNARFGVVHFAGFPPGAPNGATVETRAYGTRDRVPGQCLVSVTARKDGSNTLFAVDRAPLGNVSSVLSVFEDARLVWMISQMPTGMIRASDLLPIPWWVDPVDPRALGANATIIGLPGRPLLTLPDGTTVRGDRVMISEFDPEHTNRTEVSAVSWMNVLGAGLPSFRITGEQLGAFGQSHQAVGQARMLGLGEWVWLDNLVSGDATADGVEFPLAGKDSFAAFWQQFDRFGEVPPGAMLRATVHCSPAGSLRSQMTSLGAQKEVSVDGSSFGASSRMVEVLRTNAVIFSTTFAGATGVVARTTDWPVGFKVGREDNDSITYSSWTWGSPTTFDILGQLISGDEIRNCTVEIIGLSSVRLGAAGIPSLTLVHEATFTAAPITTKVEVVAGGILAITWDTSNPRQILQSTIDPAGGWTDIPDATSSPYLVRPNGPHRFIRIIQRPAP